MLWRLGGATSDADHSLANAFFLGPPLPFENQLYTLVEINGETHLVVLEPETGKVVWQQQLVSSQTREISQDPQRRSLALSPTISDGVVVCPTGSGAVVAVDLMTRSLRWARTYPSNRDSRLQMNGMRMMDLATSYDPLAQRWHEPFVVADQGRVMMTPPESDLLLCLDILTGENKWKGEGVKRGTGRYIVGANSDLVVLAGNTQLYAYRYDGNPAWDCPLPKGQTLAGKGIWQGDSMLIPLSGQQVIKVNAADGKILETASVDIPLGNLFAYKKQLLSISPTYVAAFYTREALESEVAERLAKDANDIWALNQQSQLALAASKLDSAIGQLEKSFKLDPQNADTRFLLVETLLRGLDENFVQFQQPAIRYAGVFEFPQQRFRYLQSMALGNVKNRQHYAAAINLLELVRNRLTDSIANQPHRREMLTVSSGQKVESDNWIAVQLARTYAQANSEERQKIYALIRRELDTARYALAPNRRQLLRYFSWLPDAAGDVLQYAESIAETETSVAERFVQPVLHGKDADASKAAWRLLNQHPKWDWFSLGPYGISVQRLSISAEELDDAAFDKLKKQFPNFRADNITVDQLQAANYEWPSGLVVKDDIKSNPLGGVYGIGMRSGIPVSGAQNRYGRPPLVMRMAGQQNLVVLNEIGQEVANLEFQRGTADGGDGFARYQVDGGLVLIETASELLAIDLYRDTRYADSLLWRYSLQSPAASPSREAVQTAMMTRPSPLGFSEMKRAGTGTQVMVGPVTPSGVPIQTGATLNMLDALTGTVLWSVENLSDQTRFATQGIELAVVEPSRGSVLILDCRDGTELRRVPFKGDWQHWFVNGPHMVDYAVQQASRAGAGIVAQGDNPVTLRVWNVFTGEDLVRLDLRERSRATNVDERYVVALEPTGATEGTLHFIDLVSQITTSQTVPKDADMESLGAMRFENRMAIFSHAGRTVAVGRNFQKANMDALSANGFVYGLNCADGKLLWERPASLSNYVVPVSQPRSSPFVAAFRWPQILGNQREPARGGLILFDLRDGSLAYANDSIRISQPTASMFSMSLLPVEGEISIGLGEGNYVFKPTDELKAPQPVFRFGSNRPAPQRSGFDFFSN
jgi:outer membrane protein assembly factor BamB